MNSPKEFAALTSIITYAHETLWQQAANAINRMLTLRDC